MFDYPKKSVFLLILSFGCATIVHEPIRKQIPVTLLDVFSSCAGQEGGGRFIFEENDRGVVSADFDWISQRDQSYRIEFFDPLGRMLAEVSGNESAITIKPAKIGSFPIPNTRVNDHGFIIVNEEFMPIRESEVACFLNGLLPSSWLDLPGFGYRNGNHFQIEAIDTNRSIEIALDDINRPPASKVCACIMWSKWFLFREKITFCRIFAQNNQSEIQVPGGSRLRWYETDK